MIKCVSMFVCNSDQVLDQTIMKLCTQAPNYCDFLRDKIPLTDYRICYCQIMKRAICFAQLIIF